MVLDDLSSPADLEGLRPDGPAGRVLITTRNATAVPADQRPLILQVGAFSPREALSYLMGRLTADPDQRLGAIDLVQDLGYDPLALAQASAVIASSVLSCRDYRDYFTRRREHMAQAAGGDPAATVLGSLGISVEAVRERAGQAAGEEVPPLRPPGQIPYPAAANRAIDLSMREAMRRRDGSVGSEHILLSLIRDDGGTAVRILQQLGCDPATVRDRLSV